MRNCSIGSCPHVEEGASCYREFCPHWFTKEKEEELGKLTLWEWLESKRHREFSYGDVVEFKEDVAEMINNALDKMDNGAYGQAYDTLIKTLVEMGEE